MPLRRVREHRAGRPRRDPVELRALNEPDTDPDTGKPFSSRHCVECFREGARRFGWGQSFERRVGPWHIGHGVAGSVYPAYVQPSSARVEVRRDGTYDVSIAAADIGTGARTVLRQIAADALGVVGVFAVGRVMNPRLARSQFLGGMG